MHGGIHHRRYRYQYTDVHAGMKPTGRAIASASDIHTGEPDPVEQMFHQLVGPLDMDGLPADQHIYICGGVACGDDTACEAE